MAYFNEQFIVTVLRWTARTIGTALLILFVAIIAGGFTTSLQDDLFRLALLTVMLGLVLTWKWEGLGGLLVLGGAILFTVLNYNYGDWPNVLIVALLFTGLLYLVCWWKTSRQVACADSDEMKCGTAINIISRFRIPLVLVAAHATLVALVGTHIALSHDTMFWIIFLHTDYPIVLCVDLLPSVFSSNALIAWTILVLGTIQWGTLGLVLQQVVKWTRH